MHFKNASQVNLPYKLAPQAKILRFYDAEIVFPIAKSIENSAEMLKFSPAAPPEQKLRNLRKERNKGGNSCYGGEFLFQFHLM